MEWRDMQSSVMELTIKVRSVGGFDSQEYGYIVKMDG